MAVRSGCRRSSDEAKALELMLTGERIDAEEARRIGLINEVVPAESLLGRAREILEHDSREWTACRRARDGRGRCRAE